MKFAKRSLGQNFLIDRNIINKIVNLIEIKNRIVVEIGPGKGALTDEILKKNPKALFLIEKDLNLVNELKLKYSKIKTVNIFNDDILKFDLKKVLNKNSVIFGNLPYNISSQILVKILKQNSNNYEHLILMFQKELGEKILGKFSSPHYGRLSILTNYKLSEQKKFLISNNCFFPKPKVTSMLIHFKPNKTNDFKIKDLHNLEKVTNVLFSNKRKMINKSIFKLLNEQEINKLDDFNINLRPSEIKPELYYEITELYEKK